MAAAATAGAKIEGLRQWASGPGVWVDRVGVSRSEWVSGGRIRITDPGLHDGQPKVFRDSAVENPCEFFERFRRLNIRSSPELDALVEQAQSTINGVEPQTLRGSNRLRQMVSNDFTRIEQAVGDLLVDRPRRNILRRAWGARA